MGPSNSHTTCDGPMLRRGPSEAVSTDLAVRSHERSFKSTLRLWLPGWPVVNFSVQSTSPKLPSSAA